MDAAQKQTKNIAFFLSMALLVAAPAAAVAQTATPNSTTVAFNNCLITTASAVQVTSSGAAVAYNAQLSYGEAIAGQWLTVSIDGGPAGQTANGTAPASTSSAPSNLTINLIRVPNVIGGTATATVTLAPGGATIAVTFSQVQNCGGPVNGSLSVSPTSVAFTVAQFSNPTASPLTLFNTTQSALTFTVDFTSSGWLAASSLTNTIPAGGQAAVSVTATPGILAVNVYQGTVTITPSAGTQINVPVTLTVGTGTPTPTGTGVLSLAGDGNTTAVAFAFTAGSVPVAVPRDVTITNSNSTSSTYGGTITYPAGNPANWLQANFQDVHFSGSSIQTPVRLELNGAVAATLASGIYTATVALTADDGATATINVTMAAQAAGVSVSPDAFFTFASVAAGSTAAQAQQFVATAAAGTTLLSVPTIRSVSGSAAWLTLTVGSFAAGQANFTLTANATNLAAGTYVATIGMGSTSAAGAGTTAVLVSLTVGPNNSGPLTLTLNGQAVPAAGLTFNAPVNGTAPDQVLGVSTAVSTSFTAPVFETNCKDFSWLSAVADSQFTPTNVTVSVDSAGIASGTTCTGSVVLTVAGAATSQTVPVTLLVGVSGPIASDQSTLNFTAQTGSGAQAQTVTISSAQGSAAAPFTVLASGASGGVTWLSASPLTGQTQAAVTVTANPAGLAVNTYQGTVTFTPTSGGSAITVNVTLTVTSQPTISATPTTLTSSFQLGGRAPVFGSITVAGSTSTFSATAASTEGWFTVSPTSGTAPATLTVTVDTTKLTSAKTFTGTITVSGTGTATGTTTINLSLTVTQAAPTITSVINGASGFTGSFSPGEVISIFAPKDGSAPIGPTVGVGLTAADIQSGKVPTTLGGVQVQFFPSGNFAPILFASATQVNAVVPYGEAGIASPQVGITFLGGKSNFFVLQGAATAPGIATANGSGTGPGAIIAIDPVTGVQSFNSPANPAAKGSAISVFVTGEGLTTATATDQQKQDNTGKITVAAATAPFTPQPLLPVGVTIDGQPVTPFFFGEAPGLVSGVMQVNVRIPATARTGDLPIVVSVGGVSSQSGVTVSVK